MLTEHESSHYSIPRLKTKDPIYEQSYKISTNVQVESQGDDTPVRVRRGLRQTGNTLPQRTPGDGCPYEIFDAHRRDTPPGVSGGT